MFITPEMVALYHRARDQRAKQLTAAWAETHRRKLRNPPKGITKPRWRAMVRSLAVRGTVP
jgi:hypothetical protein